MSNKVLVEKEDLENIYATLIVLRDISFELKFKEPKFAKRIGLHTVNGRCVLQKYLPNKNFQSD